jgi:hypothetical protein
MGRILVGCCYYDNCGVRFVIFDCGDDGDDDVNDGDDDVNDGDDSDDNGDGDDDDGDNDGDGSDDNGDNDDNDGDDGDDNDGDDNDGDDGDDDGDDNDDNDDDSADGNGTNTTLYDPRYGDKAPKSFAARVITILWMITGTIVTSLFTANVTTVLTTKNVAALQNVLGQKVALHTAYIIYKLYLSLPQFTSQCCSSS